MSRADLLALSPESVAALANLGLVKRAQREIAAGEGPDLAEDEAGVVTGRFKDGTVTRLVPGKSLRETPCSCGAVTVCRHRVAVALAYPAWHASQRAAPSTPAEAAPAPERWSPSCFTDAMLEATLGKRVIERARALVSAGVVVELDPGEIPAARLPTCAVRFHVPRDLAYARCDCAVATACEHVAVAAWAFREGERAGGAAPLRTVELRSERASAALDLAALDEARALATAVLADGVAGLAPETAPRFARARERLAGAGFVWPATLVDDLEIAVEAYRSQSARYSAADVATLLAGLAARARAVAREGELPARYLLGADEARETQLDHVRLVSLGARVDADGRARDAEVFLADPDAGIVLVLGKRWTFAEGEDAEEGPALERRAVAPRIALGAVARGQIVSRAVRRRANRSLVLGRGATDVTPQTGDWDLLPPSILSRDFAALLGALDAAPPRLLRPRVLADGMRVVAVTSVSQVTYNPGEQQISALLADGQGQGIRLVRRHRRAGPHAIDAIAAALAGEPALRFVAGDVRHGPFGLEIDPVGLVTDRLIVPDLEPAPAAPVVVATGEARHASALLAAIDLARSRLEEGCHLGLLRARPEWVSRTLEAAARLDEVGLGAAAKRVRALAERVKALRDGAGEGEATALAEAWESAAIRVELCREAAIRG